MKALLRLARYANFDVDTTLDVTTNCLRVDQAIPEYKSAPILNLHEYRQLVPHLLACLNHYRRLSVIRVDLTLPFGGLYPDNQPLDRFLLALIHETAQFCERHGCPNGGFHYAFKRTADSLGVEQYRLVLYVPQSTTVDAGFYHPSLDNYARVISDSWMQALGTDERPLCTNIPPTVELRDNTTRAVTEYQHARRMLYALAEPTQYPMMSQCQTFGVSPMV